MGVDRDSIHKAVRDMLQQLKNDNCKAVSLSYSIFDKEKNMQMIRYCVTGEIGDVKSCTDVAQNMVNEKLSN
jgi:hypothetical protein